MDAGSEPPRTAESDSVARERRARLIAEALSDRHAQAHWRARRELDALERMVAALASSHLPADAVGDALTALVESGGWQGAQLWPATGDMAGVSPVSVWLASERDVPLDMRGVLEAACPSSAAFRCALQSGQLAFADLAADPESFLGDRPVPNGLPSLALFMPLGMRAPTDVLVLYGCEPPEGRDVASDTVNSLAVPLDQILGHLRADTERHTMVATLRAEAAQLGVAVVEEETRAERASEAFLRGLVDLGSQLREPLAELLAALDDVAVSGLDEGAKGRVTVACEAAARLSGVLDELADRAWDKTRRN